MDVLTQAYAHLDSDSKLAAASAMSWIKETSLAQDVDSAEMPDSMGVAGNS